MKILKNLYLIQNFGAKIIKKAKYSNLPKTIPNDNNSLRKLEKLPGDTKVYPNHVGAVHAIDSEDKFSTISKEMKSNEAMQIKDVKEFYTYMTEGWPPKPDNWEEIMAYNLK